MRSAGITDDTDGGGARSRSEDSPAPDAARATGIGGRSEDRLGPHSAESFEKGTPHDDPCPFWRLPALAILVLALCTPVHAQLSEQTVTCIEVLMKAGAKLDSARGKQTLACIKAVGKGTLIGSVESCLTFDAKLKIVEASQAVYEAAMENCSVPIPPFALVNPNRLLNAGDRARTAVAHDVFSYDLATGLVPCSTDADVCKCQAKVAKAVEKLSAANLKLFLSCNKKTLPVATTGDALDECVDEPLNLASLAADDKGKIAKKRQKVQDTVAKHCIEPGVSLAAAFPGTCSGSVDAAALTTCLDRQVDCRVCEELNEMEGLTVDCDLFDDGADNGSCILQVQPTQRIDGNNVTCSSVVNTATYTQCNDLQVVGMHFPNDVTCTPGWSAVNTVRTDNLGFCQSIGAASMEAYYDCDGSFSRYAWNDHAWSSVNDDGFTRDLRYHY
jgi:hypothetical protein